MYAGGAGRFAEFFTAANHHPDAAIATERIRLTAGLSCVRGGWEGAPIVDASGGCVCVRPELSRNDRGHRHHSRIGSGKRRFVLGGTTSIQSPPNPFRYDPSGYMCRRGASSGSLRHGRDLRARRRCRSSTTTVCHRVRPYNVFDTFICLTVEPQRFITPVELTLPVRGGDGGDPTISPSPNTDPVYLSGLGETEETPEVTTLHNPSTPLTQVLPADSALYPISCLCVHCVCLCGVGRG